MERRDFLKIGATVAAAAATNTRIAAQSSAVKKPNVILFVSDQRTYGLTKATGYSLDTSPTLDKLQNTGIGFRQNYCSTPLCVPSRITMLTGRWPDAHRVRTNLM